MSPATPLILRLLASSVAASSKAGEIIKDVMTKGDLGIVEKGVGENDLQTEADRSAQNCIISSLAKQYPDVTIIGEEGQLQYTEVPSDWIVTDSDKTILAAKCPPQYADVKSEDIVVWVDPMDGTSEYTQGLLDHVTVLIGIAVKGRAVAGVIHQPYYNFKAANDSELGRTIWGLIGLGVGGIDIQEPPKDGLVITTTRSHNTQLVMDALDALSPREVVRVGGAGHKALLVIEGRAHAYVYASGGCKKWDTCGPEAVLEASGGSFTDLHGNHYSYDKDVAFPDAQGIFATAKGVDHAALISKIPQDLKNAFPY